MLFVKEKKVRSVCRVCGKKSYRISSNGLCVQCATNKVNLNVSQLKAREGKNYDKWKEGLLKSINK
jgi:ribosomal protein L37E